jgi:putative transposase
MLWLMPGRRVVAVDPRHTGQRCSACGHGCPGNRYREKFTFVSCGHRGHADPNAASKVLRAGLAQGGSGGRLVNAELLRR